MCMRPMFAGGAARTDHAPTRCGRSLDTPPWRLPRLTMTSNIKDGADVAVGLSLSLTHKAIGFDRRMPDVDVDALDYPPTGTLPVGVEGAGRYEGARNRQQPRRPIRPQP